MPQEPARQELLQSLRLPYENGGIDDTMSLIAHNLFGEVYDKVKRAISITQSFCPPEGYYFAYSGGKDSCAADEILDMAGVKYDKHYNVTTVDPPELVRFIIRRHKYVIYDMPDGSHKYFKVHSTGKMLRPTEPPCIEGREVIHFNIPKMSMSQLIVHKQFPPTRLQRYCCEYLKESSGASRITVTGVRGHESLNRKQNQGFVTIFDGKIGKIMAEAQGVNFTKTVRGGLYLITTMMRPAARLNIATAQVRS